MLLGEAIEVVSETAPVRELRESLGLTQAMFAGLFNITEQGVVRLERTSSCPTRALLLEMHDICNERGIVFPERLRLAVARPLGELNNLLEKLFAGGRPKLHRSRAQNPVTRFRLALGLPKSAFAVLIGVSVRTVNNLERRAKPMKPHPLTIQRMERVGRLFRKEIPADLKSQKLGHAVVRELRRKMPLSQQAQFVRSLRRRIDCSQNSFARMIGGSTNQVSDFENDRTNPGPEYWAKFCELGRRYGVEPPAFVPAGRGRHTGELSQMLRRRSGFSEVGCFIQTLQERLDYTDGAFATRLNIDARRLRLYRRGIAPSRKAWRIICALAEGKGLECPRRELLPRAIRLLE